MKNSLVLNITEIYFNLRKVNKYADTKYLLASRPFVNSFKLKGQKIIRHKLW